MLTLIFGSCKVPVAPQVVEQESITFDRGLGQEPPQAIPPAILYQKELTGEELELIQKLASGDEVAISNSCLALELDGLSELEGKKIKVRVFLNLAGATKETDYTIANYVTNISFGFANSADPGFFSVNLKPTVIAMGERLLKNLNDGVLYFTLVPFFSKPDQIENPDDITLQIQQLNLNLDCE